MISISQKEKTVGQDDNYLLSLSGVKWLGAITPFGGLAFLAGWACLAWAAWKAK